MDQHPSPIVEGLALLQSFPGGEERLLFPGEYRSKGETAEICVTLMLSVIAGQNTAMLESIHQRHDRASQLCCLSTHCLMKMCEVIGHFTSSTSPAAADFPRGAAIQK